MATNLVNNSNVEKLENEHRWEDSLLPSSSLEEDPEAEKAAEEADNLDDSTLALGDRHPTLDHNIVLIFCAFSKHIVR